ncbi:beta-class carbonic anhydrase [Macrococcus equipercicus]|uniref:carbonic anhydrase n=1 Tax=Macrococcus equipercicus TaxID=69967 RepID=A0A9Q9F313_9STAP|nr:carbonic anhydrase [Macrococcus equipercicus]KAA1037682.1 carbonic anhydrase [Macrococcus equipercicus]UTH13394.1 carbonic anhydrase [Macrococcus equipercicus]
MTLLDDVLSYNKQFVANKDYEGFETSKVPSMKAVVLTCMDTRLVELSSKALGFKNGDIKIVKNAGATITHPYGATMRSLLVGIYALGAEEIIIMGHKDCGMGNLDVDAVLTTMKSRGVKEEVLHTLEHSGIDIHHFLEGFKDVRENVNNNIELIYNHPLFDKSVPVHGLVIDPHTGELDLIQNGYDKVIK